MVIKLVTEKEIEQRFDSFVNKIIKNASIDYERKQNNDLYNKFVIEGDVENIKDPDLSDLDFLDEISKTYDIAGYLIDIKSEKLITGIEKLSSNLRDIILLYYFEYKSDEEISKILNMVRRTVNFRRKKALAILKELLSGEEE